jgi:hypothetical protein
MAQPKWINAEAETSCADYGPIASAEAMAGIAERVRPSYETTEALQSWR